MSDPKKYGETEWEHDVMESAKAREIVQEIMNFGVNQNQIVKIIYLLSLELDNRDHMLEISNLIKNLTEKEDDKSSIIL